MALVNLSIKVEPEIRQRLKVYCALKDKSITDVITETVKKLNLGIDIPGLSDTPEPAKRKKTESSQVDNAVLKERILSLKAEGLTLQGIADSLDAEGIPTARGGLWFKGTIANMLKRWEKETTDAK